MGKNFIFLHHPVTNFCFQFLSSILNYFAAFYLALSLSPISCLSRMLSFSGSCFFNGFVVSVGFFGFVFLLLFFSVQRQCTFFPPPLLPFLFHIINKSTCSVQQRTIQVWQGSGLNDLMSNICSPASYFCVSSDAGNCLTF